MVPGQHKKKSLHESCTLKDSRYVGCGVAREGSPFSFVSSGFQWVFSHFFHCRNQFLFGRNIDNPHISKRNINRNVFQTVFTLFAVVTSIRLIKVFTMVGVNSFKSVHSRIASSKNLQINLFLFGFSDWPARRV